MKQDAENRNIVWHHHQVTQQDRTKFYGHGGAILWFTGLSGSGKSTLANAVESVLFERRIHSFILDGDNIRHGLNKDLGFSPKDREENIRRIGEVAHLFAQAGLVAMTAFISPYKSDRNKVRALAGPGEFIEIYVKCGLDTCEKRDTKGLYKKARAGQIPEFTGISAPYEEPEAAELVVNTDQETLEESAAKVVAYLESQGIVPKK